MYNKPRVDRLIQQKDVLDAIYRFVLLKQKGDTTNKEIAETNAAAAINNSTTKRCVKDKAYSLVKLLILLDDYELASSASSQCVWKLLDRAALIIPYFLTILLL